MKVKYLFNRGHFILSESHYPLLMSVSTFCFAEGVIMLIKGVGSLIMVAPLLVNMYYLSSDQYHLNLKGLMGKDTYSRYMVSFYWLIGAESFAFLSLISSWMVKGSWGASMGMTGYVPGMPMPSALGLGLLNSALLLSSSATITYSHLGFLGGNMEATSKGMEFTLVLGILFLMVQWVEFSSSPMNISNGFYGSMLFSSLGFHGMHVLVGVVFLIISYKMILGGSLTSSTHSTFKASIIYWHFVDVVWVFVYSSFYLLL
uniref:Cytochrome c oxidase subunit 3 n=1 Tax=Pegea confoederata TaxID=942563 RepID=A0AA86M6H0_9UROC|nr:cytochrome c oxidase subunit III [Pegea confoederata]